MKKVVVFSVTLAIAVAIASCSKKSRCADCPKFSKSTTASVIKTV